VRCISIDYTEGVESYTLERWNLEGDYYSLKSGMLLLIRSTDEVQILEEE